MIMAFDKSKQLIALMRKIIILNDHLAFLREIPEDTEGIKAIKPQMIRRLQNLLFIAMNNYDSFIQQKTDNGI